MSYNFLDKTGLTYFYDKIKTIFAKKSEIPTKTSQLTNDSHLNYSIEKPSGTIDDLAAFTSGKPGITGSISLTKKASGIGSEIPAGWYNYYFAPHRTGSGGDNMNFGTILLTPMTFSGASWILRRTSSTNAIAEVKKIAFSTDIPTKTSQLTNDSSYIRNYSYYVNTHPENSPVLIPFVNNDIAFLLKRGGSVNISYDGVEKSIDISNAFDGSPSYGLAINPTGITEIVIVLNLHKTFTWNNTIYSDFGSAGWRAKDVKIEVINTNYAQDVWTEKYHNTNNGSGNVFVTTAHTPVGASNQGGGFNKVRFTFKTWATATIFRISQLGIYNYGSYGSRETSMSRGQDDPVFRNITPNNNETFNLGDNNHKWNNIYTKNLAGATITSPLKFPDSTALPESSGLNYLVGIDAFSDGGTMKWKTASNVTVGRATGDKNGNDITTTYSTKTNTIKSLSISGRTITYTKGDDTTGTLTTQDYDTLPSAYCTTAAATAAKVASFSNYNLLANSYFQIVMQNSNTSASALTLNVNSKGAKPIYINGAASSASNYTLPAGTYFVLYNGANYYFRTDGVIPGTIEKANKVAIPTNSGSSISSGPFSMLFKNIDGTILEDYSRGPKHYMYNDESVISIGGEDDETGDIVSGAVEVVNPADTKFRLVGNSNTQSASAITNELPTNSGTLLNNNSSLSANKLSGAISNGVTATTQNANDNSTKVATTAYADRAATTNRGAENPIATILAYAGSEAPNGYLLCRGQEVSRTTYSLLFNVIGTQYGAGNGQSTFNVPDLQGKVIAGLDIVDSDFNVLGKTGGSKSVQLTKGQLPHIYGRMVMHSAASATNVADSIGDFTSSINNTNKYKAGGTDASGAASKGDIILSVGNNEAHENKQPYNTLNYIIKAYSGTDVPLPVNMSSVKNVYDSSTSNVYSTEYINTKVRGKKLWTNQNPTSNFDAQTITFETNDYDFYKIIFKNSPDDTHIETKEVVVGSNFRLVLQLPLTPDAANPNAKGYIATCHRSECSCTNSSMTFGTAMFYYSSESVKYVNRNDRIIPIAIYGYYI